MSEYEIEALPVEAQQRVLALREARSLLVRRQSAPSGSPFGLTREVEDEISPVDLVTVASWIVTGNDPWESVPTREQVELEAQAEALLAPVDDEDEGDPEPSPTEAHIGDYFDRVAAQFRGGLEPTETIPAVPAEPTFDQVLGAPDQADRQAWS